MAQALNRPGNDKAKSLRLEASPRVKTSGAALADRLRKKAADADAGRTTDTTGLSDDQFIALLRR